MNILGERLKELRNQLGMTQADMVDTLEHKHGITIRQSHISNLEVGVKQPSLPLLIALAESLETSTDYLLGVTDNPLSARDMERELRAGGISGKLGQLLASMTDAKRQELLSIAEAFAYRSTMELVLRKVEELGGDAALHDVLESLESLLPGVTLAMLHSGDRSLAPKKPL